MKHYAAVLTAIVFWGASYMATALAYETMGPLQLGFVRAVLAALLFFLYRAACGVGEKMQRRDMPLCALSGFFGVTLYFALQNVGLALTSSTNAVLIVASYPVVIMAMESAVRRTKPSLFQFIGILAAIAGIKILTGPSAGAGSNPVVGNAMLVGSGIVWGFYGLTTQKISRRYATATLTAWQMLFGALFFIPFVLFEGHPWVMPSLASGLSIFFLAVCCSLLAFLCYNFALKGLSVTTAASLLNLMPIVGLICAWVALHERVTASQLLGGAVIVAGVLVSTAGANSPIFNSHRKVSQK
jgi:drug/metabolite transporter (DMT)-like permease